MPAEKFGLQIWNEKVKIYGIKTVKYLKDSWRTKLN